jgi:hypothetical protein
MVTSRSRHFVLTVACRIFHLNGGLLSTDSMSVLSRLAVVDEKSRSHSRRCQCCFRMGSSTSSIQNGWVGILSGMAC